MKEGDTFISPTGPNARFPERKMIVTSVHEIGGATWVDAEPVTREGSDQYAHCTYQLDNSGRPLAV
jgi:hypothetical protein